MHVKRVFDGGFRSVGLSRSRPGSSSRLLTPGFSVTVLHGSCFLVFQTPISQYQQRGALLLVSFV